MVVPSALVTGFATNLQFGNVPNSVMSVFATTVSLEDCTLTCGAAHESPAEPRRIVAAIGSESVLINVPPSLLIRAMDETSGITGEGEGLGLGAFASESSSSFVSCDGVELC